MRGVGAGVGGLLGAAHTVEPNTDLQPLLHFMGRYDVAVRQGIHCARHEGAQPGSNRGQLLLLSLLLLLLLWRQLVCYQPRPSLLSLHALLPKLQAQRP